MKVLGKLNFRIILYFGIVEVIFTVLLCYILAVTLQHKPLWLPTISECGELEPEKHFFRWGILVGGIILLVEAVVLYTAKRISTLGFWLGIIAGFNLTGVAVVASNENRNIHLFFALAFFILEDIMVLLMIFENYSSLSYKSLAIKVPTAVLSCAATVARCLIMYGVLNFSDGFPIVAFVEWINVIALLGYHLSLSDDLDDLYIAELEDEAEKSGPQKIPL